MMQLRVGRIDGFSDSSYRAIVTQLLIQKELKRSANISTSKLTEANKRSAASLPFTLPDEDEDGEEEEDAADSSGADDNPPPQKRAKVKRPAAQPKANRDANSKRDKFRKGKGKGKKQSKE